MIGEWDSTSTYIQSTVTLLPIIGHYNLFLGGILHRDISCGNILRLREPINRLVPILGRNVNLNVCRGFIIDGDHAIEWRKSATASSLERSGTLPFMSMRLLDAWDFGEPAMHTAVDDLESFLWVLIWSLVYIFKKFATMTNLDSKIHRLGDALSSREFSEIIRKNPSQTDGQTRSSETSSGTGCVSL
ncbi:hypothetical protein EDB85DRAFT_1854026 [Lactarius pseudohatsudake]|nr:hypothetical protein EDB85DRAFT_1854026 [Lactarius pseudohatsudake]